MRFRSKKNSDYPGHKAPPSKNAALDPLFSRPRPSSLALCAFFGTLMLALALSVYLLSVRTLFGQEFDQAVWNGFYALLSSRAPYVMFIPNLFTTEAFIVSFMVAVGAFGFACAGMQKKPGLFLQMLLFASIAGVISTLWKHLCKRPDLLSYAKVRNTSPSGHSTAILIACLLLLMGAAPAFRVWATVFAWLVSTMVGISLVVEKWHRPSDVVVAFFLVSSIGLYSMVFTRKSCMDEPGKRKSRPGLQVLCTAMSILSVFGLAYGFYLISQLSYGIQYDARWALAPACLASSIIIASSAMLSVSLFSAMHQITSSPLSAVGLIGPPPKPSSGFRKSKNRLAAATKKGWMQPK